MHSAFYNAVTKVYLVLQQRWPICFLMGLLLATLCLTPVMAETVQQATAKEQFEPLQWQKTANGSYVFNPNGSKQVKLATLNWAPYIAEDICGQGWVQQLVARAFVAKDYRVEVLFVPWKRAVAMAEIGQVDAVFPEYKISPNTIAQTNKMQLKAELIQLSESFPGSTVAFWKRKDNDIQFNGNLASLKNVAIGVVAGYENTPEFDALMARRYFAINTAADDWVNVRKLYNNRLDLIVGDPVVLEHAIHSNLQKEEAERYFSVLQAVEPILGIQPLYLGFSRYRDGTESKRLDFNGEIKKMSRNGEVTHIRETFQASALLDNNCD